MNDIWKVENDFVAIQTGKLTATFDAEQGNIFPLGELTKLWDNFNTTELPKPGNYWDKNSMKVKPVYGVSREWCCFKFHEPTVEDIALHVEQNFPRFIKPITKIFTHLPCNTNILSMFDWFTRGCRRMKMRWFPPAVYDTGHGFKLVRWHLQYRHQLEWLSYLVYRYISITEEVHGKHQKWIVISC